MSEHPVVGPLFSPHVIEEAVIAKLRKWLPGYLSLACQEHGVKGGIAAIKSWGLASEEDRWPEQGLPALLVVGPSRTLGEPEKNAGMYRATWPVEVGVAVAARTGPAARKYAQIYGAAIRGAILQGRSLEVEGLTTEWQGEEPATTISASSKRTIAANVNAFAVMCDRVVSWRMGPGEGKPPIPDDWPEVTETELETEIEE